MKEDGGDSCKKAASNFLQSDLNIVGVVGAYSSACSIAMQKEFVNKGE